MRTMYIIYYAGVEGEGGVLNYVDCREIGIVKRLHADNTVC